MLLQSYFITFSDIKSKHFSKTLRKSIVCVISCIRHSRSRIG